MRRRRGLCRFEALVFACMLHVVRRFRKGSLVVVTVRSVLHYAKHQLCYNALYRFRLTIPTPQGTHTNSGQSLNPAGSLGLDLAS